MSDNNQCCFIPELYDIVVPLEEKQSKKPNNIFLVMEQVDADVRKVIR